MDSNNRDHVDHLEESARIDQHDVQGNKVNGSAQLSLPFVDGVTSNGTVVRINGMNTTVTTTNGTAAPSAPPPPTPSLPTPSPEPSQTRVQLPDVTHQAILPILRVLPALPTADGTAEIHLCPETPEQQLLEQLFSTLPTEFTRNEHELILRAYVVASYAHREQYRKSGEPYIHHPLLVTIILAELHMDADTLAAGLLHDVAEDTEFGIDYIRKHFGDIIAVMVDGVTKLKKIKQLSNVKADMPDHKAETLRKMFLAMVEDVRVVIIKLADRLHNMRTLDGQKEHSRRRIARETLEIFAPLANRLGIWQIKWELEDKSFRYLEPSTYRQLAKATQQKRVERERWGGAD